MDDFKWDDFFDVNFFDFQVDDPSPSPPPLQNDFSVDDLEQLLMIDDDNGTDAHQELSNAFMADILLDFPIVSDGEVVDDQSDGSNKNRSHSAEENEEEEEKDSTDADAHADDDPLSKKRKRQLRNRDAAVRSRERKKVYVRDLELKSRYYEGECKRLGMLLQCYLADNQALRLSLQNSKAFDASVTKQESAVLLLESLLLGSLLWFLGIICLLILPSPFRHQPSLGGADHLEIVKRERLLNLTPEKVTTKFCDLRMLETYLVSKRCKASRSRMKISLLASKVLA